MLVWWGGDKLKVGDYTKFAGVSQLHEAIALQIFYYNTKRIHTALKMSLAAYAAGLMAAESQTNKPRKGLDPVLQKVRGCQFPALL